MQQPIFLVPKKTDVSADVEASSQTEKARAFVSGMI